MNVNQKPTKKRTQRWFFFSTEEVDVSIHIINDHVDFLNEKNKYYNKTGNIIMFGREFVEHTHTVSESLIYDTSLVFLSSTLNIMI